MHFKVRGALDSFSLNLNQVKVKYFTMKRRRGTVNQTAPYFHQKICQKDQIKRASSGLYQYDGDQLDDVANSSEGDEGLEFKIGIPGSRTIFGKEYNLLLRIVWVLLTIVCCFLAFYQVKGCIIKYESENVVNQVKIMNNETLIFPSVTMCNTWIRRLNPLVMEAMRLNTSFVNGIEKDQTESDFLSLVKLTAKWDEIGDNSNISFMFEEVACWFRRNSSCEKSGYWEILHTPLGPCFSFRVRKPVKETGIFNGFYIKIGAKSPFDNWLYYIHPHNVTPALNVYESYRAIKRNPSSGKFNSDVEINYHQVQSLNVKRDRCVEDPEYTTEQCELECFSEQLVRQAGCLLPFMKLSNTSLYKNSPICNTTESYSAATKEMVILNDDERAWNRTGCHCITPCFRTYYETDVEKVMAGTKAGRFRLRVFFQTRTYEENTQRLEYGLINLFCAIGNSVGLMLGASVLTLCETLEWGAFRLIRWMKSTAVQRGKLRRIHPHPRLAIN